MTRVKLFTASIIYPEWRTTVTYKPHRDLGKRKMAIIELAKNTLAYNGYTKLWKFRALML